MAKQAAEDKQEDAAAAPAPEERPRCGIIMPISESPDFPGHWAQVRTLIERAADKARFTASMVSENDGQDMIHASIIKNIYHNPVVVCDVSSLNPNVMLELGLRMATKKPLVLVFDGADNYPFDIKNFIYAQYPKSLHFFTIEKFVNELADKIKQVYEAEKKGAYKPFLSHFNDVEIDASALDTNKLTIVETLVKLSEDVRSLKIDNQIKSSSEKLSVPYGRSERTSITQSDMRSIKHYAEYYNSQFGSKESKEELENMIFHSMSDDYFNNNPGMSLGDISKIITRIEPTIRKFTQMILNDMGITK